MTDPKELVRYLSDCGLDITPDPKHWVFLARYFFTADSSQFGTLTTRTGWTADHAFVLPNGNINESDTRYFLKQSRFTQDCHPLGTLQDWQTYISVYCRGNRLAILTVSMAFGSPLLSLLKHETGGIHLRGHSSSGKTTLARIACSVWGSPGYIRSCRATTNGLEGVASNHNDLPLVMDELGQMDPRQVGQLTYMLANNIGKQRANRQGYARDVAVWTLLFLTTGEVGLEQHMNEGGKKPRPGQEIRLVDVPADAGKQLGVYNTIHGYPTPARFSDYLREETTKHYGTAGPEFIKCICRDIETAKAQASQIIDDFVKQVVPDQASGQVRRVAGRFGLIAAGGELATRFGITGWDEGEAVQTVKQCFEDWLEQRGSVNNLEVEQAVAHVHAFFETYGMTRFPPMEAMECDSCKGTGITGDQPCIHCYKGVVYPEPERNPYELYGYREIKDGRTYFLVFSRRFKQSVCEGHDPDFVIKVLRERGELIPGKGGTDYSSKWIPGYRTRRVYIVTLKAPDSDPISATQSDAPPQPSPMTGEPELKSKWV